MFCEDIQDIEYTTALQSLMGLFAEQLKIVGSNKAKMTKMQLQQWVDSQASFIKALFMNLSWES